MPFLQIFADQLSQTAASLPGANVKHPSSAAVWAYAHLDINTQKSAALCLPQLLGVSGAIVHLLVHLLFSLWL